MWTSLFLLLFMAMLPFATGFYPIVRFVQEQIDIDVYASHIVVKGYYTYTNPFPFPVIQGFSIPFPVDSTHSMPVMVSVTRITPPESSIPLHVVLGKHRFDLYLRAWEEVGLCVEYSQQTLSHDATYLLTTTKPWIFPLKKGVYRLFPKGVHIVHSNYVLHHVDPDTLSFQKEHFMPDTDWHFSWEVDT